MHSKLVMIFSNGSYLILRWLYPVYTAQATDGLCVTVCVCVLLLKTWNMTPLQVTLEMWSKDSYA